MTMTIDELMMDTHTHTFRKTHYTLVINEYKYMTCCLHNTIYDLRMSGRNGPFGCLALARWAGVGRHVNYPFIITSYTEYITHYTNTQ